MQIAAKEVVTEYTDKQGKKRLRVKGYGSIRKPAYFADMAVFRPKMRREWHFEQWFPLSGYWLQPEPDYRRMVGHALAEALRIASCNPAMFRVIFRDDYTHVERVVGAGEASILADARVLDTDAGPVRLPEPVMPQGGPYLRESMAKLVGEPAKPPAKPAPKPVHKAPAPRMLTALEAAFLKVGAVVDIVPLEYQRYTKQACYIG